MAGTNPTTAEISDNAPYCPQIDDVTWVCEATPRYESISAEALAGPIQEIEAHGFEKQPWPQKPVEQLVDLLKGVCGSVHCSGPAGSLYSTFMPYWDEYLERNPEVGTLFTAVDLVDARVPRVPYVCRSCKPGALPKLLL